MGEERRLPICLSARLSVFFVCLYLYLPLCLSVSLFAFASFSVWFVS